MPLEPDSPNPMDNGPSWLRAEAAAHKAAVARPAQSATALTIPNVPPTDLSEFLVREERGITGPTAAPLKTEDSNIVADLKKPRMAAAVAVAPAITVAEAEPINTPISAAAGAVGLRGSIAP